MMMMEAQQNSAVFSVIFFDGVKEIDLGGIVISPSMNFQAFQSIITQKIGISPHQITTYFTPFHHQQRRRPVTKKFDFAAALPESAAFFFFVVLKRSRRARRRRTKNEGFVPDADNFVLLRRNPNLDYVMSMDLNSHVYSDLSWPYFGGGVPVGSDDGCSSSGGGSENRAVFCDVCWNAQIEGKTPPFHWCKNDAVTVAHRSSAGPIAPPARKGLV